MTNRFVNKDIQFIGYNMIICLPAFGKTDPYHGKNPTVGYDMMTICFITVSGFLLQDHRIGASEWFCLRRDMIFDQSGIDRHRKVQTTMIYTHGIHQGGRSK